MSEMTELPEWVWNLLDALNAYEDEHAPLYVIGELATDGEWTYERAACFGAFLRERKAWPPREVQDAAAFRRHVLREHATTPTAEHVGEAS